MTIILSMVILPKREHRTFTTILMVSENRSNQLRKVHYVFIFRPAYNVTYDYNTYVPSMNAAMNGSAADNGAGQAGNHPAIESTNYESESRYGLGKPSIVSSPKYQSYPIT